MVEIRKLKNKKASNNYYKARIKPMKMKPKTKVRQLPAFMISMILRKEKPITTFQPRGPQVCLADPYHSQSKTKRAKNN